MASIVQETVVITFSKLIKSNDTEKKDIINEEILASLEEVAQQLVDNSIIVEIEKVSE